MMFNLVSKELDKTVLSYCFRFFISLIVVFVIALTVSCLIVFFVKGANAGIFSRDKIPYDLIVEDTITVKIPSKKYTMLCFDGLFENKLYDCYIVEVTELLGCIDDVYMERKPKPTPTPIPIQHDLINKPKD